MGWPLIVVAVGVSVLCTVVLGFVQIRSFGAAWRYFFSPGEHEKTAGSTMTPAQALINALNSNLGNGTIAGVAVSLAAGGPGAAFWLLVMGFMLMAVRFAEVFLSVYFGARAPAGTKVGGPMIYLAHVAGKSFLPYAYALLCFCYGLVVANGMQVNSIGVCVDATWGISPYIVAFVLFAFVVYVMVGGAERILSASEKIVPLKVGLFVIASLIVLVYHWRAIVPSLSLMATSAFSPLAITGGLIGFTVQQAMREGILRVVMATEAGLGTAAIIFGATKSANPVKDAIMSMLSTFITTVIAFTMALCIVASGAWNSGLTSTALTMASFQTVFGSFGGLIVMFLAVTFGLGAVVAYAFVARQMWIFLTGGAFLSVFAALYCAVTFLGCIVPVSLVWAVADTLNGIVLAINLYGIVSLLPTIARGLAEYRARRE